MARKKTSQKLDPQRLASHSRLVRGLQHFCLGMLASLLIATALLPTDASPERDLGVPLILLWIVLLVVWALTCLARRGVDVGWCYTDLAVAVLVGIHSFSALRVVVDEVGNARLALNMLWRWIALAIAYFLVRQLVSTAGRIRVFCSVMIALAVGLATIGLLQHLYVFPQQKEAYFQASEAEKQELLQREGIRNTQHGAVERTHFESRLFSDEPMATFALANSLAGVLAAWLTVSIAIGVITWPTLALRHRTTIATVYATLIIGFCLLLTKSRSAYLAFTLGLVVLGVLFWRMGLRLSWKVLGAAIGVLAVMTSVGILIQGIDARLVYQATQSLTYRLEYWQSTWSMITDHPWFGCGPGNFQTNYPYYKLPSASETVSEPHNFLLEMWATAGTPAVAALVAVLVCWATQIAIRTRDGESGKPHAKPQPDSDVQINAQGETRAVYLGALAGVGLAFPCGLLVGFVPQLPTLLVGLPTAVGSAVLLHWWVERGRIATVALVVPVIVLVVNFLAAGGISFLGVALSWWLLIGMSLQPSTPGGRRCVRLSPRSCLVISLLAAIAAVACQQTALIPVVRGHGLILEGDRLLTGEQFDAARERFDRSQVIDPFSPLPWQRVAYLELGDWIASGAASDSPHAQRFKTMIDEYVRRDPRAVATYSQIGDWYLTLYRVNGEPGYLQLATKYYQMAAKLYPMSNFHHAQLAWAYHLMGQAKAAADEATRALQLDALMPHQELRLRGRPVFDGQADSRTMDTEQIMLDLRKHKDLN